MSDLFNANDFSDVSSLDKLNQGQRCHDIDWLRALAFILLIFYHIGMFYVSDWGWHVKSDYQSSTLQYFMLVVNPWRMPLIFFISGFALALVAQKFSASELLKIRFIRLFIPLVFASNIIIIPQPYFEAVQNYGYNGGFWQFALEYFKFDTELLPQMQNSDLGLYTWNHLWYLVYLWFYTIVFLILSPALNMLVHLLEKRPLKPIFHLIFLASIITLIEFFLEPNFPKSHALVDDWYNHARYFLLLLTGYFVARIPFLYWSIIQHLKVWLLAVMPLTILSLMVHKTNWFDTSILTSQLLITFCLVMSALCCLFCTVALCGRYLRYSNRVLRYLNEAILPWYILHQTVTIILAMLFASLSLGGIVEPILVILGTFLLCAILFELIKLSKATRFLFGMKLN